MERKQQLDKSLASTIENGAYLIKSNPITIFVRDWYLWALQLVRSGKHWLEQGNRREGMVKYQWQAAKGTAFLPEMGGGRNFPQVYCMNLSYHDTPKKVRFTDDVIFSSEKCGLFQLVAFLESLQDAQATRQVLCSVDEASGGALHADEVAFILNDTNPHLSVDLPDGRVAISLSY